MYKPIGVGWVAGTVRTAAVGLMGISMVAPAGCTIEVPQGNNGSGSGGGSTGGSSGSSSGSGGLGSPGSSGTSGSTGGGACGNCPRQVPASGAVCPGFAQCDYPQAHDSFLCTGPGTAWVPRNVTAPCPTSKPVAGAACPVHAECSVCEYAQGCNTSITTMLCDQGLWFESPLDATSPRIDTCGQGPVAADAGPPPTASTQDAFAVQIQIDGASRYLIPQKILGGYGSAGPEMHLPTAAASNGSTLPAGPNDMVVGILTNPAVISGPGSYVTGPISAQGVSQGGQGVYVDPQYKNVDGSSVAFQCQPGGTLAITRYSTQLAGRIAGSFSCALSGAQLLAGGTSKTLAGNMSGTFDVALTQQNPF